MRPCVFVLGSFVVDCAYRAARLPNPGETVLGSTFGLGPGGKGSNQAVAAARAGAQVCFQTACGDDAFGQIGRQLWQDEGIDATAVKTVTVPTGSAAILLEEGTGSNQIVIVPGACNALEPSDVERAATAIRSSTVFVTQLELPYNTVERGLTLAREAGVPTILNPAPAPAGPLPERLLQLADYLLPNESEAKALTGVDVRDVATAEQAARHLQSLGASHVIVTLGAQGALLLGASGTVRHIPAFCLGSVVDTSGAGDAFCGAFSTALAEGRETLAALQFASAAAGLSVMRPGTAASMPNRAEIDLALGQQRLS